MKELILVSNRLPVTVEMRKESIQFVKSVGGLATGLSSLYQKYNSVWIGWCGVPAERLDHQEKEEIEKTLLKDHSSYSTFLSRNDVKMYYQGFCNKTIWPLFHYFTECAVYDQGMWESYIHVNKLFSHTIMKIAKPGDIIWIHDYHLMLLPKMIRKKIPDVTIGFFLHIPFPSFEVFRLLPWGKETLEGLLGADLIGFHTFDYVRHFLSSVRRILGYDQTLGQTSVDARTVKIDAFPMGIDFEKFHSASRLPETIKEIKSIRNRIKDRKVILSVDRLDYTKGILHRLEAFDYFLKKYPEYKSKVTLILVAVPSRTGVETYIHLKRRVDEVVGAINGRYGAIDWTPILYFYRSFPFHALSAFYHVADVALVTPLRDGMNLIAKEYIAAKSGSHGAIVLSETAGAACELNGAIIVNPNDREEVAEAIHNALTMPEREQRERIHGMQLRLKRYDVVSWANDFMERLKDIKNLQVNLMGKKITGPTQQRIQDEYIKSNARLIFLDYDGTLVPFAPTPDGARPDRDVLQILRALSQDPCNEIVLISGRERKTLEKWFGKLNIGLIAEHGVWLKPISKDWSTIGPLRQDWKEKIRHLLEHYVDRTPGSLLEEKDYSLVWHYRQTDHDLAQIRVQELKDAFIQMAENLNLEIMDGNKVLEIKSAGINKGVAALRWIRHRPWDFILAIGDDITDENIFSVLPDAAFSIKVGLQPSLAKFFLESFREVRLLLKKLYKNQKEA
ncbi:bifunctional alpha,alpha-trehalose-phosphate synthase (UDP-forming)/trehalose-phosphatase [Candidatus Sumerlaeota bacterium]|nr:bifunctional alpha,alpha-trehalose-phosphate synthase (UDP-forming)/trehalose-phosphatase [Candidatus Sumerlaeota bacterium]